MSSSGKIPADFQPVENPSEAKALLKEGAKMFSSATLWTKNQHHVIHTHLTLYSEVDGIIYAWIPKDFDPAQFVDELVDLGSNDCFFSVSLAGANIFFKTLFKGYDEGGLQFFSPEKLFKVQRRKDVRFPIPDGRVLKVNFQDPLFPESRLSKKVIDISAGGLGFLATEFEEGLFHPGLILKQMGLSVNSREITLEGEVRHYRKFSEDSKLKGIRVGVRFQQMKPSDAQFIAQYVFEESRKYFSKFL